ncbi:fluoride efflux transporter CrcB, partial [Peptococcaceae bacterium]|nr:fluoride efflux transporter CrcB [Peptococcaceae bacterium]
AYLYVGLGGILGSISRYIISLLIIPVNQIPFPWDTLIVNLLGCYLLSFLASLQLNRLKISAHLRSAILIGFIGSFTTFSTFSVEIMHLLNSSQYITVVIYSAVSLAGGLILAGLGLLTAQKIQKTPGEE